MQAYIHECIEYTKPELSQYKMLIIIIMLDISRYISGNVLYTARIENKIFKRIQLLSDGLVQTKT
jgi:hypothetical protein